MANAHAAAKQEKRLKVMMIRRAKLMGKLESSRVLLTRLISPPKMTSGLLIAIVDCASM